MQNDDETEDNGFLIGEAIDLTHAISAIFELGEQSNDLNGNACKGGVAVARQLNLILARLAARIETSDLDAMGGDPDLGERQP